MPILHVAGSGSVSVAKLAGSQALALGATATNTGALGSQMVRLVGDVAFNWNYGAAATAATTNIFMAANSAEYFVINVGDRIAAITATGGTGTLWVAEVI